MKVEGFEELGHKLDSLADRFEEKTTGRISGSGQDPQTSSFISPSGLHAKDRIGIGIAKALEEDVIPEARRRGGDFVPNEDKQSIDYRRNTWYNFDIGGNDMVKYHEFGTSTKATDKSKATINAPNGDGYVIPLDGYDSLPFGPDAVETMDELNFQFVVHPGVESQHFIREALYGNIWRIKQSVARELDKLKIDI